MTFNIATSNYREYGSPGWPVRNFEGTLPGAMSLDADQFD